ncbi:type II toxin-antitoxin system PemK/MazF family toxin [Patescibacteria group bacterium]|nr:type II toxin-antitoxin system PemK/MazF family toxin [Patescibacteria group bacterium]MBP9710622.1 type II toxin-antitoxin system PemK/MazF family toxin [Patescibacteria group bacterium]
MDKGTIILVPFPFTDLSGHKVRPCLVLSSQKRGDDCIVAFLSSVEQKRPKPFDLKVRMTSQNGLKKDSLLKLDKLATLQRTIIIGELGVLEASVMKMVDAKLRQLFQLM